jgi:tetratricopeptide (TPR) repeat protein
MIRRISLILSFLAFFATISAGTPDSLYYKANQKYQEGKYEESIELYQKIISEGFESSVLYYNLGNASFRSNKIGKARIYYEKALKLDPNNEDATFNLTYLEGILVDKFEDIPELFLKTWLRSLISLMNSDQWAIISMAAFFLAALLFSMYLLLRKVSIRKTGFYGGLILLLITLFSFAFSWKQRNSEIIPESAVVIEYLVNVKSTPRDTGTDLFVLHEGAKVWLEDIAGEWREIRLSDGRKGWVPIASIENI